MYGEIDSIGEVKTKFVRLDDREFIELELNVESFNSEEDLVIGIQNLEFNSENFYKIVLEGRRKFEINSRKILKLSRIDNLLKIKDFTKTNYNLEELAKENNLKGYFVKEALKKLEAGEATEEEVEKAIEIGLDAM